MQPRMPSPIDIDTNRCCVKVKVVMFDRVAVLLLAAGRSSRFGAADKLSQPWRNKPLARHAGDLLAAMPFAAHLAVIAESNATPLPEIFDLLPNREPERGLSHSIALGIAEIGRQDIDACLIALADMPLVPQAHFSALVDAGAASPEAIVATGNANRAQVPALFGRTHFDALCMLQGDRGAAMLLRNAEIIECDPVLLADFDQPGDFT